MCIRDSTKGVPAPNDSKRPRPRGAMVGSVETGRTVRSTSCLLYTSDAADERSSVDLGGRRIIKKKTTEESAERYSSI